MNYITQMIALRDSLPSVAVAFNISSLKKFYIHRRENNGTVIEEVIPTPVIQEVSLQLKTVEDLNSLKGMSKVFEVKGISKKYQRIQLESELIDFEIEGGIKCQLIDIKENIITWDLRVEQKLGEQQIYGD
ncbi:MAG: hypothetical protein HWQ38_08155 [Nostoc sp. NMS7]|uniref:hypothetical protein n=1 Tax=Nostoc sp. NMS7 TaxID=2815391 RepID=UPI0025F6451B|nr:hypothetical protein [Nostoc sp. NMS7]MBN3946455.1 hypothetical protein [Nostoc sp. NMS7]